MLYSVVKYKSIVIKYLRNCLLCVTLKTQFTIGATDPIVAGANPMRWMLATLIPLIAVVKGLRRNLFTKPGALLALVSISGIKTFR